MEQVQDHSHNGIDSRKLRLSDLLAVTDTVPTHAARDGSALLYVNGATFRIYFRVGQAWKYATLS